MIPDVITNLSGSMFAYECSADWLLQAQQYICVIYTLQKV